MNVFESKKETKNTKKKRRSNMKFSSKIEKCGLSPMRKFAPYANEAAKKGKKLYHLNIGQPDIATPAAYFEAVKNFSQPVLAYAPSDGVPEMIDAVVNYYGKIDAPITNKQVLITTGGSEALQIALSCILDEEIGRASCRERV